MENEDDCDDDTDGSSKCNKTLLKWGSKPFQKDRDFEDSKF